jgi:hypothetical protein
MQMTITPCSWAEPHEPHTNPGALRSRCLGVATEFPNEHTHSAVCATRRLTDGVMRVSFLCVCERRPANQ